MKAFIWLFFCFANAEDENLILPPDKRYKPDQWRFLGNDQLYGFLYGDAGDTTETEAELKEKQHVVNHYPNKIHREEVTHSMVNYVEGINNLKDSNLENSNAEDTTEEQYMQAYPNKIEKEVDQKQVNYVEGIVDFTDSNHEHSNSLQNIVTDHFYDYSNESNMLTRDELLANIKDLHKINLPQHILDDFPLENVEHKPKVEPQVHVEKPESQRHPVHQPAHHVHQPAQDQQDDTKAKGCVVHYHYHYY
eukprot:GFUD01040622.1.p1 GENE.GFUD01040622.1~~GFUD01040622.1.p1  ORF type:complete len:249 (-),score=50.69 GFUD01040622.1:5-751(-)